MNRGLLQQVGGVRVEYHPGPFRRGFHVKTNSQGGGDSCGTCAC